MSWRPGVPYIRSNPGFNLEAIATNQAKYLTRYSAALAAGDCDVINAGDSMSAPLSEVTTWRTWPYVLEAQMQRITGSADVDVTSPSASAAWRMLNLSQNAWSIQDHMDAGSLISECTTRQPDLVIISCGLITWLTDPTGETYGKEMKVGVESIRSVCDADIMIVHQYEPEIAGTWANWGEVTEPIARELADRLNCAYVSVFKPVGSIAGSGDPGGLFTLPSPVVSDEIHLNGAGQEIIAGEITPVLTRNRQTSTGSAMPVDLGQSRSTSTSELSVLTSAMTIPANSLASRDELFFRAKIASLNLSGSAATVVVRLKIGGTTVIATTAIAIANGTGIQWDVTCPVFAEAVGATSVIRCEPQVEYITALNGTVTTLGSSTAATPLTVSTLADISIDLTTQHGGTGGASAGMISECTWATLSRVTRFR